MIMTIGLLTGKIDVIFLFYMNTNHGIFIGVNYDGMRLMIKELLMEELRGKLE